VNDVTVVCVLRTGKEYRPEHVRALQEQVARHSTLPFVAMSDVPVSGVDVIPLQHPDWTRWWCKMELFSPDMLLFGDILFIDLDTWIVGSLDDIGNAQVLTVLSDFYRGAVAKGDRIGSGLMYIPRDDRPPIWERWMANPAGHMRSCSNGDQEFLEKTWKEKAERWQALLPGQVVSYKVHVRGKNTIPADARVVCFHGHPRPWEVKGATKRG